MFAGHSMLCPYDGEGATATRKQKAHEKDAFVTTLKKKARAGGGPF
jgi:hypothetical protein